MNAEEREALQECSTMLWHAIEAKAYVNEPLQKALIWAKKKADDALIASPPRPTQGAEKDELPQAPEWEHRHVAHPPAPDAREAIRRIRTLINRLRWKADHYNADIAELELLPFIAPLAEPAQAGLVGEADGASLIVAERARQMTKEGWTPEHDDTHQYADLAVNAAILCVHGTDAEVVDHSERPDWNLTRHPRIKQLIIAGALIAAEIDRVTRRDSPSTPQEEKP